MASPRTLRFHVCVQLLALLACVGGLGHLAQASPADRLADSFLKALEESGIGRARELLDDRALSILAKEPTGALMVCGYAAIYAQALAESATPDARDGLLALMDRVQEVARLAVQTDPRDGICYRAMAHAGIARARTLRALRLPAAPELWFEAAHLARRGSLFLPDLMPEALPAAEGYVEEAVPLEQPDRLASYQAAYEAKARLVHQGDVDIETRLDIGHLAKVYADVALAKGDRKAAGTAISFALDVLDQIEAKHDNYGRAGGTLYNRLLGLAHSLRLETKRDFRVRAQTSRWKYLGYDKPVGWSTEYADEDNEQTLEVLIRSEHGTETTVELVTYWLGSDYYDVENQAYGGDNISGLSDMNRKMRRPDLTKLTRERKSVKGRLNANVTKTHGFELQGKVDDSDIWIRGWVFKGEHRERSYLVVVTKHGRNVACDPELERLLDSIKELPGK